MGLDSEADFTMLTSLKLISIVKNLNNFCVNLPIEAREGNCDSSMLFDLFKLKYSSHFWDYCVPLFC